MSGLNPFTRTLLRMANWIAGESQSEWTMAMAAETDSAGGEGLGWALGCVGAAFTMRLREDRKRIALLALVPFLVNFLEYALFLPAAMILRAEWIAAWALVPLSVIPPLALIFWAGWSAPGPFPIAFAIYLLIIVKVLPLAVYFALVGEPLFSFSEYFGPNTTHWMLPAVVGFTLSLSIYLSALALGYAAARERRAKKA